MQLHIRLLQKTEQPPYPLLLTADPSRRLLDVYLPVSETYLAFDDDVLVGVYVLCREDADTMEIKNLAVEESRQGQGIGKLLLTDAAQRAKEAGVKILLIGTADTSVGPLKLYRSQGFETVGVRKDFFIEHYEEPIYENGVRCRDMILLAKRL